MGIIGQQIEDLNNIIQYENANIMNFYSTPNQNRPECPDDILVGKEDHEENPGNYQDKDGKFLNLEELRKMALEVKFSEFFGIFYNILYDFLMKFK